MDFIAQESQDLRFIVSVESLLVDCSTKIFDLFHFQTLAHLQLCTHSLIWSRKTRREFAEIAVYVDGRYRPFRLLNIEHNKRYRQNVNRLYKFKLHFQALFISSISYKP